MPSRRELARAVRRVVDSGWSFTGASDHLVSEALYLDDPEGNGIEIYRDRPRDEWARDGGELRMATLPLDLDAVMAELDEERPTADGAVVGHVHLQVAEIPATEAFYAGGLGLDVTVRGYPGALFLSAGGYHHHIGANTWGSAGAAPPPAGARGLRRYTIVVPDEAELAKIGGRIGEVADGTIDVVDPAGNAVRVVAADAR